MGGCVRDGRYGCVKIFNIEGQLNQSIFEGSEWECV